MDKPKYVAVSSTVVVHRKEQFQCKMSIEADRLLN